MISPMLFPDIINKYCRPYNESLVIIENNAEGSMVATQLHYDIESVSYTHLRAHEPPEHGVCRVIG